LESPSDYIFYIDEDKWVVFKRKDDISELSIKEILESNSFDCLDPIDLIKTLLSNLKIEELEYE